ncbi:putative acid proteinase protein [Rosellinia necatrix]|uniref:Putative acid proteinase protein n=1 Tax=Rosellinia necatrix TaxID=77044 RepID=A0A1W2TIX7_ROSNE|nr:putative acid proteinase protein [Rosellinia necatrix]
MKTATLATGALLAATALAAPGTAARWAKHAARRAGRGSGFKIAATAGEGVVAAVSANGTAKHVEYSTNWAGAVLSSSGYTSVVGTITVPTPKGTGRSASASAWVGIDGDTCGTAILQTGLDFSVSASGAVSYDAWYEWYPDYAYDFTGFSVKGGDQVKITVTASSKSAGVATLQNLSTGKSVSHSFSSESNQLCEYDAEWIVEDYESGGSLVPFADFDAVTFTGAAAVKSGATVGVAGATILDIKQGSAVLTDCSTSGSSTVTCTYV